MLAFFALLLCTVVPLGEFYSANGVADIACFEYRLSPEDALGGIAVVSRSGAVPDWQFTIAIVALAILVSIVASIPPALYSAYRDPVLVLRHG